MPHIQVKLIEGKSEEQKKELTLELVKAAQKVIGMGDESYSVSIEEFPLESWKTYVYANDIMGKPGLMYKKPGYEM
ncbi:tautomerase family protein [Aegicerativicinus sediminis]